MEGMSRVNKYQNLRKSITEGKEIDRVNTSSIERENELNARANRINKQEIEGFTLNPANHVESSSKKIEIIEDDDFTEGLYLSSDDLSDENMNKALSRVKESDNDSVSFNTRLDILNAIKLSTMADLKESIKENMKEEVKTVTEKPLREEAADIKENAKEEVQISKNQDDEKDFLASLAEIIKGEDLKDHQDEPVKETAEASDSKEQSKNDTKAEESKKNEEFEDLFATPLDMDINDADPKEIKKAEKAAKKAKKKAEKEAKKLAKQEEYEEYEEYDEEKSSAFEKILTFLIIVIFIVLVAIIGYIIKLYYFNF